MPKKAPRALLPGLSRWIQSTLGGVDVDRMCGKSHLSSPLCSFRWRDQCPKAMSPFPWQQKNAQRMVFLTFGDKQKSRDSMNPWTTFFKATHVLSQRERKLAELATMEVLRDLGRDLQALQHHMSENRFPNGPPIWLKDWLNILLKLMWCFQVYLKVLSAYTEPKRFEKGPHEASPSCETRWIPVGTSLNQSVVRWNPCLQPPVCLGHLHRLHLLRRWSFISKQMEWMMKVKHRFLSSKWIWQ